MAEPAVPKARRPARRTLDTYSTPMLGTIAIVVVAALVGTILLVKGAGIGYRSYTAQFAQAAALQAGNPITIAGIQVGEVARMSLVGDRVEAKLRIRDHVALGKDSKATIKITTILGSRYLALHPAGPGALPNDTFDLAHTEVPYDLQEALADVTTTYEQVDTDRFAESLAVLGTQLKTLPPVVPAAVQNIHTLSSIIGDRRDQLGSLLKTTQLVSSTLERQHANIANMVRRGQELVGEFVMRRASFHAMMTALTNLVQTLSGIVIDDRPRLEKLLTDLRQLSDMLGKHDDMLRSTLQSGPIALRGLANATGTGNAVDLNAVNGLLVDSWMCAISGRAQQFGMIPYYKDCK